MFTLPMSVEPLVALALLAVLFVSFLLERYPPEVIAAGTAATFLVLGLVETDTALLAFSNPAPLTIAAMFVISGALVRTGMLDALAGWIVKWAEKSPKWAALGFVVATVLASGIANNTPVVLVLIPVVIRLAQTLNLAETRVLIPLSYVAILGGTLTLVGTSTNILVAGVAAREGLAAFSIFEITPVGIVVVIVGLTALAMLGPLLLPSRASASITPADHNTIYLTELRVGAGFDGIGLPLKSIAALNRAGLDVVARREDGKLIRSDLAEHELVAGDEFVLRVDAAELLTLKDVQGLVLGTRRAAVAPGGTTETLVAQALVRPGRRRDVGTIAQLSLGEGFGLRVLGAFRPGHRFGPDLRTAALRPADVLLLEGTKEAFDGLDRSPDLVTLGGPTARAYRRSHAPLAALALLGVVALAAMNVADISILSMIAVAVLLAARCIDSDEAWGFLDGGILILIFSMLIVGSGLQETGAVALIVETLAPYVQGLPPIVMLAALYLLTSVLTEVVSNNAVAIVVTPIAISLAHTAGVDPRPFVVAVMFGASASFATPIGYQTNTLVYGAGNYRFSDFLRIGIPMNLIVGAATVAVIPILFPF